MMNTYVNRFSFALNDRKDEVTIVFAQDAPQFASNGAIEKVDYEPVANLVMSQHMASELAKKLLKALNGDDTALIETPVQ